MEKSRPVHWVSIQEVSKVAVGAVIVSEDWAFYSHQGYDANQIREAIREDWEQGKFARGASTITQQVVKNVFLERDKNLWRKIKELYLAVEIEKTVGKKRILETYLNIAEWGEGVFGIRAASNLYFSKHPSELTAREGAFLAMLLPSPKRYSQSYRSKELTPYARRIVRSILEKMVRANYLTTEEKVAEMTTPFSWETAGVPVEPGSEETLPESDEDLKDLTPEERGEGSDV
jgi:monofunctional biosynthetic peptidoglycan transglycosylase